MADGPLVAVCRACSATARRMKAVRRSIEAATRQGVKYLTLFAFSSENWQRPQEEVQDLRGLLLQYLRSELQELHENGVRLKVIGELTRFGPNIVAELAAAEAKTAANEKLTVLLALSYGGRSGAGECGARSLRPMRKNGKIRSRGDRPRRRSPTRLLATAGLPDPGSADPHQRRVQRISRISCCGSALMPRCVFLDVLWPDFGEADFAAAIRKFGVRERRFGARPE